LIGSTEKRSGGPPTAVPITISSRCAVPPLYSLGDWSGSPFPSLRDAVSPKGGSHLQQLFWPPAFGPVSEAPSTGPALLNFSILS
jgi:hypothetical protein